jgi:hypothetical protein
MEAYITRPARCGQMRPYRANGTAAEPKFDLTNRRYLFFGFCLRLGSATATEFN